MCTRIGDVLLQYSKYKTTGTLHVHVLENETRDKSTLNINCDFCNRVSSIYYYICCFNNVYFGQIYMTHLSLNNEINLNI